MPGLTSPDVDIGAIEAEITDASRQMRDGAGRAERGSGTDDLARAILETMAQEAWRIARLSAD